MNSISFGESPRLWKQQQATNSHIGPAQGNSAIDAASMLLSQRQQQGLNFTSPSAAERAVLQVLARDKRRREESPTSEGPPKKQRKEAQAQPSKEQSSSPVLPSEAGISLFNDHDVLSGRGGGTNGHPGNRYFRDLINRNRRAYLKARKNDKPGISRAIVRSVRERGGRFLKRNEGSTSWFEIGDDAAREKTSQALRQRAPEMRKVLFETEMEQLQQKQRWLGMAFPPQTPSPSNQQQHIMLSPFALNMTNKINSPLLTRTPSGPKGDAYAQYAQSLMTAALLRGGINRTTPHGA